MVILVQRDQLVLEVERLDLPVQQVLTEPPELMVRLAQV